MKITNKFMVYAMLALMVLLCISASSAAEPLSDDLGAYVSNDTVSVSEDTYVVDANGGGDYETSSADSDAAGGKTVFTENGKNTDLLTSTNSVNLVGDDELTNVVTNATFYSYFDKDGFLLDSIKFNNLTFKGTFSNVSDYIILNKSIAIAGDEAVLNNIAFVISSENVELDGLTLVSNNSLGDLISVGASNTILSNLDITYIVDDEMANAISVSGRGTISNVTIKNNKIYFESQVKDDEELTTAINLNDVENVVVDGNDITAEIPGLTVNTYDYTYFMMGLCYVNPVRIYEGSGVNFTNNKVDVKVNSYDSSYPTVQALYIVGSDDVSIKGNNITMRDTLTPAGTAIYLYAVECGFSSEISFVENDFDILTTGGKSGAGSAYALQIATSDAEVIGNNITCDSNGPNLGIYLPYGMGPAKDLVVKENFINVTGLAEGTSSYALVSGIEVQTGYATIYNNTIYSMNKVGANDRYPISAVSAVQYSASTLSFDIQDNEIYTNGKYAVDIRYKVQNANVIGNYLTANTLKGDDAAYIRSGENVVENNTPVIGIVTNKTFFNFFDDSGVLKDNKDYYGLTFEGNFSDLVDTIVFNRPFKVFGNNTVLNNIAVRIEADDVELSGFNITADKEFAENNGAAIYATGSNIEIDDVVVNYNAPDAVEAIGIYANAADNFALSSSKIMFVSANPGSKHHYGLEIRDSNNVLLINNEINATLPAVGVDYMATGIDTDLVLAVGIQGGENITFISNDVNVNTNGGIGDYPTVDAVMIHGSNNVSVILNKISHIDTTTSDISRFYYALDLYSLNATVENNNIFVNTTAGADGAGTAYPIQLTGPATVTVKNNNLTSMSKGANSGIYAANWNGPTTLIAEDNTINVTGYATSGSYSLVSGIEAEIDVLNAYNNTITVNNLADYDDANQVYGISMVSSYMQGTAVADINNNIINVDGKYAVYYIKAINTNVTYNSLYAHELAGDDAAIINDGENNIIENNQPPYHFEVIIDANGTWIGNNNIVKVTVTNATGALGTGKVSFKIANTLFTVELVDGQASYEIPAGLLVVGENNVTVDYESNNTAYRDSSATAKFQVVDGVVTQDNYMVYFNQADNGKLFDYVPEGVTLDFQGSIINPDQANVIQMNVNKPVNIISSTQDAYIDLNTTAGSLLGESPGNSFSVTRGGSKSNVTGIFFHNTQIWISNTTDVVLDNISVVVEDQRVGSGVGATSIRDNSSNVVLKNSYLYTKNNSGSTTFTMSWTTNCTIDNCTVKAEGNVGNLIYLNVYNIVGAPTGVPLNNNNTVSNNRIYGKEGSGISIGLMIEGTGNLIVNNTLYKSSISTSFGAQKPADNIYAGNTLTEGGSLTAQANSIVYDNNVTGSLTAGANSQAFDNIVGKSMTVTAGATAYNNTVATSMSVAAASTAYGNSIGTSMTVAKDAVVYENTIGTTVSINGANAIVTDNIIGSTVTVAKAATNTTFVGNDIEGVLTVNSNDNNIKENNITVTGQYAIDLKTATGNNVTDNYLTAELYKGDAAVKYSGENLVENNIPAISMDVIADSVWIGSNGTVVVSVVNGTGNVTIKVNDKDYVVELDENGTATKVVPAEDLVVGGNNVTVTYETEGYLPVTIETALGVLDGVVTNVTYEFYFDDSGYLVDLVPENTTLDFQGLFLGKFPVYIDKAINVISSTGDALFDAGDTYAGNAINSFNIIAGGDNTNITGLDFINYCLYIKGASNVTVDNISIVANKRGVGSGTGFLSIHTGAYNTLVKNSYFENGGTGSSLLVLGKGGAYAVFDHNVFNITGSSGNILSANQFVGKGDAPEHVSYTNNVLYNSQPGSPFCYAMTVSGSGNLLENNTIYHNGSGILNQYGASSSGNVYRNNTLYGNTNFNPSANSIVENNKIYATTNIAANTTATGNTFVNVAISGTNTTFENNIVNGTVTVNGNDNNILGNDITSTGDYAVDLKSTTGNLVTGNYLTAELYKGDAAVKYGGENNTVENNYPAISIDVVADSVWIGSNGTVVVSVVNGTGNVTIKVNDKEYVVELDENGTCSQAVPAEDLVVGGNNVTVTYETEGFLPVTIETALGVLDGVITNATYQFYFDERGNLAPAVPNDTTLDFQGLFLGKFPVYIDKSVNVVSSTGDALFDCGDAFLGNTINSFNIIAGADNTNITGLQFANCCLYIKGASNVTVDDIIMVADKRGVGSGTGFLSIHSEAYYTTVKNSYFENGGTGSSVVVLGKGGKYATFDNNVFNIVGSSGNVLSSNIFVGAGDNPEFVNYTNNIITSQVAGSSFMYGITVCGQGNIIENNSLLNFKGNAIVNQFGATSTKNIYRNNTITGGGSMLIGTYSLVENNNVAEGTLTVTEGSTFANNTAKSVTISGKNVVATDNIILTTVTISAAATNTTFANNFVNGLVTVNSNENTITENNIISDGEFAVDLKSTQNNTVTDNVLYASDLVGDKAVSFVEDKGNVVENNLPMDPVLVVEAENIKVGENATINVSFTANVTGTVEVIVDGKKYNVDVVDGKGQLNVSDLAANKYTVGAYYEGDLLYVATENTTSFTVEKQTTDANITLPTDFKVGEDTNVTVSIPGATGNVSAIVDGVETVVPLDENGTAVIPIENLTAGEHSVVVVYDGDDTHAGFHKAATFAAPMLSSEFVNITVDGSGYIDAVLVNSMGDAIANATVVYKINGAEANITTDENGWFLLNNTNNAIVEFSYAGSDFIEPANVTINLQNIAPSKTATVINSSDFTQYSCDYYEGERGGNFTFQLLDMVGNPLANKTIYIGYNGVTLNRTTDANGYAAVQINLKNAGIYTFVIVFLGDENYNASMAVHKVTINKKTTSISASAKTFKATAKTKKYTVTLKTIKGSSIDGKTYLAAGKKVTLKINGKTYTAKTNAKGQATFSLKITKKGKFTTKISFDGDKSYEASSKSVKITIK